MRTIQHKYRLIPYTVDPAAQAEGARVVAEERAERDSLRQRIAELEGALRPFAEYAESLEVHKIPGTARVCYDPEAWPPTGVEVARFYAAKKALSAPLPKTPELSGVDKLPETDNAKRQWLKEKAEREDGCFVSVGGLVTDVERRVAERAVVEAARKAVHFGSLDYPPDPAVIEAVERLDELEGRG